MDIIKEVVPEKELADFIVKELKERELERKHTLRPKRRLSLGENIFNSIIYGIGALMSVVALIFLIIWSETALEVISVTLFCAAAIFLYTMSCLYHSFPNGATKSVFKRFVHLSIYLLIAGAYTPFSLLVIGGTKGWVLFGIQWSLAVLGIIFKSTWVKRYNLIHTITFLIMGWSILAFGPIDVFNELGLTIYILLIAGGISYSIGIIFFKYPIFKFHQSVWHTLVLIGSLLHFISMFLYLS